MAESSHARKPDAHYLEVLGEEPALGLWIVKRNVGLLRGTVFADNAPGGGFAATYASLSSPSATTGGIVTNSSTTAGTLTVAR